MKTLLPNNIREIMCFQLDPTGVSGNWGISRPAFKLTFSDNSLAVLKGEMLTSMSGGHAQRAIAFGAELMGEASPSIQAELCSETELSILRRLSDRSFGPRERASKTRQFLNEMIDSRIFTFYKMPYLENLRSIQNMIEKGKMAKMLGKMKMDPHLLFELGKIVAVDAFIGNYDRFRANGEIGNTGNIIFQKTAEKKYMPVGLDFFHAESAAANVSAAPPQPWGGLVLRDRRAIQQFAMTAIRDLNNEFLYQLGSNTPHSILFDQTNVNQFALGMTQGAEMLRTSLVAKLRQGRGLPPGVVQRLDLLGWR